MRSSKPVIMALIPAGHSCHVAAVMFIGGNETAKGKEGERGYRSLKRKKSAPLLGLCGGFVGGLALEMLQQRKENVEF